jgi:hypothetical protein
VPSSLKNLRLPRNILLTQILPFYFVINLFACSQYAIEIVEPLSGPQATVAIPESAELVEKKILEYLRKRRRLESVQQSQMQAGRTFFLQPWVRDSSLRYMLLKADDRIRHLSEWKAQWTLEALSPKQSLLSVDVLEIIHMGPPSRKRRPEPEEISAGAAKGDWVETPPDKIRAAVELRRFWTEYYLSLPLPSALANVNVKNLNDPPLGLALSRRQSKKIERKVFY